MAANEQECAEFCEREYPRLVGALRLFTGDAELARDIAQESLARACARWSQVARMEAPGAWVHRVAVNIARSGFRRRAVERRAQRRQESVRPDPQLDPADALAVREAVLRLPERQRLAVVLRYYAGLPVEQAAEAMRCRPGTVKALTHQGLAGLRAALADDEEEVHDGA